MSEKKIIQFDAASQVNSDAYVPITQLVNGNQKTLKALIDQLGAYISRVQQYNDLDTTAKDLIGAINEAAESGSVEMEQTVTTPVSIASINDGGDNIPVKSLKVLVSAVQSGSGTPSPSNIRSISGWSGANVFKTGKNLIIYTLQAATIGGEGLISSSSGTSYDMQVAPVIKGQTYTIKSDESSDVNRQFVGGFFYTKPVIGSVSYDGTRLANTPATFTAPITGYVAFRTSYNYSLGQCELGSYATTYEAPKGTTHTIPFGQTVYGGLLDVIKGVLTITHGIYQFSSCNSSGVVGNSYFAYDTRAEYNPSDIVAENWAAIVCDRYNAVYSIDERVNGTCYSTYAQRVVFVDDRFTSLANAETILASEKPIVVYPLATPTKLYLSPTQVKTLLTCNIFSDTGDIDTLIYFNSNADEVADVVEAYVGDVVNLYATLATGNTSVTISSSAIHTNSTIDIYTDNDVDYISAVVTEGQIAITFDAQASDLGVKVRVS